MEQLHAVSLDLNTDVVEWCPTPQHHHLLAVGTYQLDESTQQRHGRLYLYSLMPDGTLRELATLNLPGIFDLRWHLSNLSFERPLLAAALADGSVRLLSAAPPLGPQPGDGLWQLHQEYCTPAPPSSSLAVSLDYSRCKGDEGSFVAASYSDGSLQYFQASPSSLTSLLSWQAHDLEAWAAATDYHHPSLIYSGGDDAAFKVWDVRQGVQAPVWSNRKAHAAGVCCVASSPYQEHIVATGSYDEAARLWDLRAPHRPLLTAQVGTGGGVWRLKWHPSDPQLLLAACMHAGFAVLRAAGKSADDGGGIAVVEEYPFQKTLAYGADWCRDVLDDGKSTVATCSFYERLLHVWSPATRAQPPQ